MKTGKRKNYTQLPSIRELGLIMGKVAKRPLAEGKQSLHYVKFGSVIHWLECLGISPTVFKEELDWRKVIATGLEIEPEVVKKTLQEVQQGNTHFIGLIEKVTDYLGEEDQPQKSDLIFVFGSQNTDRIAKAVQLWKEGLAPVIFISGGRPHYAKPDQRAEALVFQDYALEQGVPKEKIIVEPNSIAFADNVRRSLNLMDKMGILYSKMILITAWFSLRRAWSHMMKYVPQEAELFRVVCPLGWGDFTKKEWYKNERGVKVIFNEFVKMKMGVILNTN